MKYLKTCYFWQIYTVNSNLSFNLTTDLMKLAVRLQLMGLMFLLFFTWGSWYGQMGKYLLSTLGATGDQVGNAYTAFSLATIVSPFFVGLIADRYFSAQRVMAFLNLVGAAVLYFLIQEQDPGTFFWYILAYTFCFTPNLALSTSIAMRQMENPEKDYPSIRVMGTVAWIVISVLIGTLGWGDSVRIFEVSMYASLVLAIWAWTLPDTPPASQEKASIGSILGKDALVLFKERSFVVFFISSILICIPLSFYYALANPSLTDSGMLNVETKMALGQASEVGFMLILPFAFIRLGVKKILIVGLIAWIIRFIGFGYGDGQSLEWLLYLAIILHGICYDFFFVTGQIYTDAKAGPKIKNSAQGLITLATYGVGMGIGSKLSGLVLDLYTRTDPQTQKNVIDWLPIWLVPAGIAAVVLVFFILAFRDEKEVTLNT